MADVSLTEQELDDLDSAITDATTLVAKEACGKHTPEEIAYIGRLDTLQEKLARLSDTGAHQEEKE